MTTSSIEQREGGYWIKGTRISLDSLIYAFQRGETPPAIQQAFPGLTLAEIEGALTFYRAHQQEMEAYLAQAEATFAAQAQAVNSAARVDNPALFQRLERARRDCETARP